MFIFFDLDGTLIDISRRWWAIHCDLTKKYGLPRHEYNKYVELKRRGISEKKIMRQISIDHRKILGYCKERLEVIEQRKYLRYDKPFHFVGRILKGFYKKDNRLVLLTSRHSRRNLLWELGQLGLRHYFSNILSTNGKTKRKVLSESGYDRKLSKSVFVSDSYDDYLLAKKLKQQFFTVTYGCRDLDFFKQRKIKGKIIDNPQKLKNILCES